MNKPIYRYAVEFEPSEGQYLFLDIKTPSEKDRKVVVSRSIYSVENTQFDLHFVICYNTHFSTNMY